MRYFPSISCAEGTPTGGDRRPRMGLQVDGYSRTRGPGHRGSPHQRRATRRPGVIRRNAVSMPKILSRGGSGPLVTQCGMPAVDHGRPAPLAYAREKENSAAIGDPDCNIRCIYTWLGAFLTSTTFDFLFPLDQARGAGQPQAAAGIPQLGNKQQGAAPHRILEIGRAHV